MSSYVDKLFQQMSDIERRLSSMVIHGTVHEIKGDKMRIQIGKDEKGEPILGPWLNTSNQRGEFRHRTAYAEGQNVTVLSATGDPAQGVVMPFAPNEKNKAPDHANKSGKGEDVGQLGELRTSKGKDGYDVWLEDEEKQQGESQDQASSSQGQGEQQEERKVGGDKAKVKMRVHKDGVTMRFGTGDSARRFAANEKGVKMKVGKDMWLCVLPDKIVSSVPIIQDEDPMPDDNK